MCVCVSGGLLEADELYMYWELEAGVKRDGRGVEGGGGGKAIMVNHGRGGETYGEATPWRGRPSYGEAITESHSRHSEAII